MKIVVKLGGSISIDESGPNIEYFKKIMPVLRKIKKQHQLIVSIGGGKFVRSYYAKIDKFRLSNAEKEWIAVALLTANVRFVASALGLKPLLKLEEINIGTSGVIGGIKPGRSTDANAAYAAQRIGADLFIKLTDVDGVYTADPDTDKNAKKIKKIPFSQVMHYAKSGKPGDYGILDRTALQIIKKNKIKTVVIDGRNTSNLLKAINGEKIGTVISD
ncbi:MAG: hypothetical protein HZB67_03780 [Candidatus Aenigmarchaeota archaeon]|nr:hypothetical protein [Candidatus Aenigmarchaeota archaeon]